MRLLVIALLLVVTSGFASLRGAAAFEGVALPGVRASITWLAERVATFRADFGCTLLLSGRARFEHDQRMSG